LAQEKENKAGVRNQDANGLHIVTEAHKKGRDEVYKPKDSNK